MLFCTDPLPLASTTRSSGISLRFLELLKVDDFASREVRTVYGPIVFSEKLVCADSFKLTSAKA